MPYHWTWKEAIRRQALPVVLILGILLGGTIARLETPVRIIVVHAESGSAAAPMLTRAFVR